MKRMLEKTEQGPNGAFDAEHPNRLAVLEMMAADTGTFAQKWEDLAGEEVDESGIYGLDEVGLGSWFGSGLDD